MCVVSMSSCVVVTCYVVSVCGQYIVCVCGQHVQPVCTVHSVSLNVIVHMAARVTLSTDSVSVHLATTDHAVTQVRHYRC